MEPDHPAFRQMWTFLYIPEGTLEQVQRFNDLERVSTSPDNALRFSLAFGQITVEELLHRVSVPTIVSIAIRIKPFPSRKARLIAAGIANAKFVPLASRNHVLLNSEPAWEVFLREL